jgi:sorting nexin-27
MSFTLSRPSLFQYLQLAQELSGYGDIVFPHCPCDSRKEGHVVAAVGLAAFKLHATKEDGTLESQVVEFQWNTITRWEIDDEGMAFCFQYTRTDNRSPRWLKVFTPYVRIAARNFYLFIQN